MGRVVEHWWSEATAVPSPNQDSRPPASAPRLIVIHCISLPPGVFGGPQIDALFCNCLDPSEHPTFADLDQLRVSAHALVRRDGRVHQYVAFDRRAWHAGSSSYRGKAACNDYSIGIELEGLAPGGYTPVQYAHLTALVADLMAAYPSLTPAAIVGHQHIAPVRKTDPGPAFDWPHLRRLLARRLDVSPSRVAELNCA
ncbi:MAG: 1,6-anhydro-N-acetylmuramyl-L-alanine amidase AmpD [Pseudomonadota bacterium]|nr:1,6-anhydro-N-acetylmuramyl-L-alanine amidase AmpD [Pseudomonadota bacterium]